MAIGSEISDRIVEALLARKLAPGSRLGEQQLATLFGCSRTIVREALTRLAARGLVSVSPRRGWYVMDMTPEQAGEVFEARRIIETGLLRSATGVSKSAVRQLRRHVKRQQAALPQSDTGLRSFLLGDFHVCLAECLGNRLLAETVRDLTVRTTLAAMHHQSEEDAAKSCSEHERIVEALEAGDLARAEESMAAHLATWQAKLRVPSSADPLLQLRRALQPVEAPARTLHTRSELKARKRRAARPDHVGDVV